MLSSLISSVVLVGALSLSGVDATYAGYPTLTSGLAPPLNPSGHPYAAGVQNNNTNCDLNIGGFGMATSLITAYGQGFFQQLGIKACYYQVKSSSQQFNEFFTGNYDLIQSALDNMMNRYYNGQVQPDGSFAPVGVTLIGALELQPSLTLVASGGLATAEQLAGTTIFVDAVDSGLLYAAFEYLQIHGLYLGKDYQVFPCGGKRYQPVITGTCNNGTASHWGNATLISAADLVDANDPNSPFNSPAVNGRIVFRVSDYLSTVGTSLGTKPSVMADPIKGPLLEKLVQAAVMGHRFASNPANADLVTLYLSQYNNITIPAAQQLYAQSTSPIDGLQLIDDLHVDQVRLNTMFDLRLKYNGFHNPTQDFGGLFTYGPGRLIDPTVLDQAAAAASAYSQVVVSVPDTLISQCFYNAYKTPVQISNVIATLSQYVSGGCNATLNSVVFTGVTSDDPSSELSDFTWDGTNLNFNGADDTRTYTATFNVFQACSSAVTATITQTYKFYSAPSNSGPADNLVLDGGFADAQVQSGNVVTSNPSVPGWTDVSGCGVTVDNGVNGAAPTGVSDGSLFTGQSWLALVQGNCAGSQFGNQIKSNLTRPLDVGTYRVSFAYSAVPRISASAVSVYFTPSNRAVAPADQLGASNAQLYAAYRAPPAKGKSNNGRGFVSTLSRSNPGAATSWTTFTTTVTVTTPQSYNLWFYSTAADGGQGGYVDDVIVEPVTAANQCYQ